MRNEKKIENKRLTVLDSMRKSSDLEFMKVGYEMLETLHNEMKSDENNFHKILADAMREEAYIRGFETEFERLEKDIDLAIKKIADFAFHPREGSVAIIKGQINSLYGLIQKQNHTRRELILYIKKMIDDLDKLENIEG